MLEMLLSAMAWQANRLALPPIWFITKRKLTPLA